MNRVWPSVVTALYCFPMALQFRADAANTGARLRPLDIMPDKRDDSPPVSPEVLLIPLSIVAATGSYTAQLPRFR